MTPGFQRQTIEGNMMIIISAEGSFSPAETADLRLSAWAGREPRVIIQRFPVLNAAQAPTRRCQLCRRGWARQDCKAIPKARVRFPTTREAARHSEVFGRYAVRGALFRGISRASPAMGDAVLPNPLAHGPGYLVDQDGAVPGDNDWQHARENGTLHQLRLKR